MHEMKGLEIRDQGIVTVPAAGARRFSFRVEGAFDNLQRIRPTPIVAQGSLARSPCLCVVHLFSPLASPPFRPAPCAQTTTAPMRRWRSAM